MCYNRNIFLGTEDKVMEKSKVYFTDFRTRLGEGLPSKLKRLMKAAGIQDMDMDHKFVAIKMHFGELGLTSQLCESGSGCGKGAGRNSFPDGL